MLTGGAGRCILITGASGTLGGPLTVRAEWRSWDVVAVCLSHPESVRAGMPVLLDLRDGDAVQRIVQTLRPEAIIHAAVSERSPDFETAIPQAARQVALAAREVGARLVAISTDLVFDGTAARYTEDSVPRPKPGSIYGQVKAQTEQIVLQIYPAALVVRPSLIYDFDPQNAQAAWMIAAIERGEPVRLFTDQVRCPIWVVNLADALLELVDSDAAGILHIVGPEPLSRYTLGTALLTALGYDLAAHVIPVVAPDHVPKRLVLSSARARALLKTPLLSLDEARAQWERSTGRG